MTYNNGIGTTAYNFTGYCRRCNHCMTPDASPSVFTQYEIVSNLSNYTGAKVTISTYIIEVRRKLRLNGRMFLSERQVVV